MSRPTGPATRGRLRRRWRSCGPRRRSGLERRSGEKAAADARSEEQRRKRRWQLAAAGVVVVALVGGLAGLGAFLRAQAQSNADLEASNADLVAANEREKQAKDKLETTLYYHRIALAYRELLENNLLQAEELLDQCPPDQRGWEWYYLKRLRCVEPVTLRGQLGGWFQQVALSPDGQRLASASDQRTVKVWDATTGEELLVLPDTGEVRGLAFRPRDGRWLATGDNSGAVTLWDTTTRQAVRTLGRHTNAVIRLAFSPDGRLIASASEDKTVQIWDATNGKLVHSLTEHERPVVRIVSPHRTVSGWSTPNDCQSHRNHFTGH